MIPFLRRPNAFPGRIPCDAIAAALRVHSAMVFVQPGRTKVEGLFKIKHSTRFLFEIEDQLPRIPSEVAAVMATRAGRVLPLLLIVGLFTCFAAPGLIAMTAVIAIFVHPDPWIIHGSWIAPLLALFACSPGGGSLVRWIGVEDPTLAVLSAKKASRGTGGMTRWI